MRFTSVIVALSFVVGSAIAGSVGTYSLDTNTAVKIIGEAGVRTQSLSDRDASTAYEAQGALALINSMPYFVLTTGTTSSATSLTTGTGLDVTDGTVVWRPCLSHARKGLTVVNTGGIYASIGVGTKPVVNTGVILYGDGGAFWGSYPDVGNAAIFAIGSTGVTALATSEF